MVDSNLLISGRTEQMLGFCTIPGIDCEQAKTCIEFIRLTCKHTQISTLTMGVAENLRDIDMGVL
jgi:hypothetical protein